MGECGISVGGGRKGVGPWKRCRKAWERYGRCERDVGAGSDVGGEESRCGVGAMCVHVGGYVSGERDCGNDVGGCGSGVGGRGSDLRRCGWGRYERMWK